MRNFQTIQLQKKRKAHNWVQNYLKSRSLQIFCQIFLKYAKKLILLFTKIQEL